MTSESQRTSFFLRNQRNQRPKILSVAYYLFRLLRALRAFVVNSSVPQASGLKPGLSLVELLIAIGILGVTMVLIGAAFPAGVAMSIAVSDETTSQTVFQKAVAEIKANLSSSALVPGANLVVPGFSEDSRKLSSTSSFSWSALIRRVGASGPMGNLCQVVVVVSRRPGGSPDFEPEPPGANTKIPELRKVNCTSSNDTARTLEIDDAAEFDMVPNGGYIIDGTTGTAYIIVSRDEDNNKVVTLGKPPSNADIGGNRDFWLVPGPNNGPKSPAIRVFQAMLYLP